MYFYLYYYLSLMSSCSRSKLVVLVGFNMFISINFFSAFENSVGFNNFFYLFVFKLLNTISNIDTNLIFLLIYYLYLVYLNYKSLISYLMPMTLILFSDFGFFKNLAIGGNIFNAPNLNLLNGLFLIHPLLLILLLIYLTQWIFDFYVKNRFIFFKGGLLGNSKTFKQSLHTNLLSMSLMLVITGGWWAQQELNWGGWWAWDFVELANLNIVLLALLIRHFPKVQNTSNTTYSFLIFFYFISIIPIYLYTRYNLIPSVHSFLSDLSFLQYDYFIDTVICALGVVSTYIYIRLTPVKTYSTKSLHPLSLTYLMFLVLLVSFFALIVNFSILKSISVVLIKAFQIISIVFIFFHLIVKFQAGGGLLLALIFNPILTLLGFLVLTYTKLWRIFANLHYLFYLFVFLIIYNWGTSDLLFYNSVSSASSRLTYFWFKFNNFFIVDVDNLSFPSSEIYNSTQRVVESYFLNSTNTGGSLISFDPIYIDNYSISNSNTLVSVNRTLFISYYFYYLLPLYLILAVYLTLLLKMF